MGEKYLSQQELCDAVYNAVRSAKSPMSRLDIARAIGRKKSPHLLEMIEHLTIAGYFLRTNGKTKRGLDVFEYSLKIDEVPPCEDLLGDND